MTLLDVLPQVEQLDRKDLIALQMTVSELLREYDHVVSQEEIDIVTQRYADYLDDPDDSVSADDMLAYLDDLVQ